MTDYAKVSYWLESCGDDLTPRESLDGSIDVDVAILGAGYTGLWTAYYLQQQDPSLSIAIVEREIVGFGASGRNGAWCTSGFGAGPSLLTKRYSVQVATAVHDAMVDTVAEVGRVCEAEGIDAQFQRDGEFLLARGPHQIDALDSVMREYDQIGRGDFCRRMNATEASEFLNVQGIAGAVHQPASAAIHPGRLVRGLARVVESRGARIFERTSAIKYTEGVNPILHTDNGDVRAKVVVLAGESYLSEFPKLHRQVMPVYSLIVLTEPLSGSQLEEINWTHRSVVHSASLLVDYLSRTADGRILFGGRGAPYHWGSKIRPEFDNHEPTHQRLRETFTEWFPQLGEMKFTHAWGGSVGVPRDWMPTMTYDRATGIASSRGYTGEGVAATNLGGRVLADQIVGADTERVKFPMVGHHSRNWEIEPLRWIATRYLQTAAIKVDQKGARTGKARTGRSIAERLIGH